MLNILNIRKFLLIVADIFLLYASLAIVLFFSFGENLRWKIINEHLLPFSIIYFFWLIIFYIFSLYDLSVIRIKEKFYTKIFSAILMALAVGMIFFYLSPISEITPKTNLILNAVIFTILFLGWRKLFFTIFSARLITRVAIIGKDEQTKEIIKEIRSRPYLGYQIVDVNLDGDLLVQARAKKIDTLIVPANLDSSSQLTQNLYRCLSARVNFLDISTAYELICEKIPNEFLAHTWFLENLREGEKKIYDNIKKGVDIILASFLLAITLPLWPVIALLIKSEKDGGPVFYQQERIGKDGKSFFLIKFRSMNQEAEAGTGAVWAKEKDPRVTTVGKFLRYTHLDELPQMINVLRGDISLVGPRPERPEFINQLEREIPHYRIRHLIKPGFTGWAQIKFRYGRSVIDSQEKFQYDLYYLKNRSLLLDMGILLKTFQLFFKK